MDDNTIEALREVLQDMTTTIELLLSGDRSGEALIHFVEDMLKTIESWASKYNVVLDDGSIASMSVQDLRPENHSLHLLPSPSLPSQEAMTGPLDAAESLLGHHPIEGHAIQPCRVIYNQEHANTVSTGDTLEHSQIDGTECGEWQAAGRDHSAGITSSTERRKTRLQASPMDINVTAKGDGKVNICSFQSEEGLNSAEAGFGKDSFESKGDRTESPSWLPEGWTVEAKAGGICSNIGSKNKVYVDPTSNHCFQSKKEVLAFLGRSKRKRGRPRKTELTKDMLPGHGSPAVEVAIMHEPVKGSISQVQLLSNPPFSNDTASKVEAAVSTTVDTMKRKRGRPRKVDSLPSTSLTDFSEDHTKASDQTGDHPDLVLGENTEAQAILGHHLLTMMYNLMLLFLPYHPL